VRGVWWCPRSSNGASIGPKLKGACTIYCARRRNLEVSGKWKNANRRHGAILQRVRQFCRSAGTLSSVEIRPSSMAIAAFSVAALCEPCDSLRPQRRDLCTTPLRRAWASPLADYSVNKRNFRHDLLGVYYNQDPFFSCHHDSRVLVWISARSGAVRHRNLAGVPG
jgi:hypothetical protein